MRGKEYSNELKIQKRYRLSLISISCPTKSAKSPPCNEISFSTPAIVAAVRARRKALHPIRPTVSASRIAVQNSGQVSYSSN